MSKSMKWSQGSMAARVLVGTIGLILSVMLHELFHVLMHWGHITHVNFFPTPTTLVQLNVVLPDGYDLEGEEIAAYGITLLVILITTVMIFKMGDSDDKRSAGQILFPNDKNMQEMNPEEMLALSGFDGNAPPAPAKPKPKRAPRK